MLKYKSSLGQNTQPKFKKKNLHYKRNCQTVRLGNAIRDFFEKRVFESTLGQPIFFPNYETIKKIRVGLIKDRINSQSEI